MGNDYEWASCKEKRAYASAQMELEKHAKETATLRKQIFTQKQGSKAR